MNLTLRENMNIIKRTVRASAACILVASLATGAILVSAPALANDGGQDRGSSSHDDNDDHGGGGFGSHPSLPVPAALVFGGLAIAGVAGVLHRRKSRRDAAAPKGE